MQHTAIGLCIAALVWTAAARRAPAQNDQPAADPARISIEQAVDEALRNNLSLLAEKANVGIAEARVITARLRPNPVLSAGGDHLDLAGTGFSEANGAGPSELNLRSDLLLERGAKRRWRVQSARLARTVTELAFLDAARILVLDTQSAFVDAQLARDSLSVARLSLESLDRIVEINEARARAGDLSRVELIRSRLAALQFRNSVRRSELRLNQALTRLATLMGRTQPESVRDVEGDLRRDPAVSPLEVLKERALRLRPDLLALRGDIERAGAEVRLQQAQASQDYMVGAEYRRQQGANGKSNSLGFFLEIPLPLFDRNQGEIERARREQRQLELRGRALEQRLSAEIDAAYQQYATARDLLHDIDAAMVGQARDVREITVYSYRRGDATLLELLDAERAFNETMQSYHEARAEYARALYILDSVSGKEVKP